MIAGDFISNLWVTLWYMITSIMFWNEIYISKVWISWISIFASNIKAISRAASIWGRFLIKGGNAISKNSRCNIMGSYRPSQMRFLYHDNNMHDMSSVLVPWWRVSPCLDCWYWQLPLQEPTVRFLTSIISCYASARLFFLQSLLFALRYLLIYKMRWRFTD